MSSRNTYHLICVSLTLDLGYLFTASPAKLIVLLVLEANGTVVLISSVWSLVDEVKRLVQDA